MYQDIYLCVGQWCTDPEQHGGDVASLLVTALLLYCLHHLLVTVIPTYSHHTLVLGWLVSES